MVVLWLQQCILPDASPFSLTRARQCLFINLWLAATSKAGSSKASCCCALWPHRPRATVSTLPATVLWELPTNKLHLKNAKRKMSPSLCQPPCEESCSPGDSQPSPVRTSIPVCTFPPGCSHGSAGVLDSFQTHS